MKNLSEQLYKNLLQRAYSYVDGGLFEKEEWADKMTQYLEAYNELLGLSKQDIDALVDELWHMPNKVDDVGHSIGRWASLKKEQTKYQTEMRNSIDRLFKAIDDYRSSGFFKELLEYTVNLFEDNGYSVGINYPYSNSEAPVCLFTYQSMMLEVNKRVYLEQRSAYLKMHCDKKRSVRELVNQLLERVAG